MARPTIDLDWAEVYAVDPTSGQGNRVAYPAAWQDDGWSYQEKPPRNYDNQFKWLTGQWVKYLDEVCARPATYIIAADDASAESKAHADAVCDGTDDQAEINAGITAVGLTGGVLMLTEGTFNITAAIAMAAGVHVIGRGRGHTIIKVDPTTSTDFSIVTFGSGDHESSLQSLKIDGNATNITQNHRGVEVTSSNHVLLKDLQVVSVDRVSSAGEGIYINNSSDVDVERVEVQVNIGAPGFTVTGTSTRVRFTNCLADTCGTHGFYINASYNIIDGCVARLCTSNGLLLAGDYNRVSNCELSENEASGLSFDSADGNLIANNHIHTNKYHGIVFQTSDDNLIRGNYIHSNSQQTDNTYNGIDLDTSATNVITDNIIRMGGLANQHYAGIDLNGNATSNRIYNNDVYNSGVTATIYTAGGGSAKTIPAWTAQGADSSVTPNLQDNVVNANRTVV
jgi:parallel beta-helix repeat protein